MQFASPRMPRKALYHSREYGLARLIDAKSLDVMEESEKGKLTIAYRQYNYHADGTDRFSTGCLSTLCQSFAMSSDW